jgi:hypothetical protein
MNYMGHTTDLKLVENHKPDHNESCMYIIDKLDDGMDKIGK